MFNQVVVIGCGGTGGFVAVPAAKLANAMNWPGKIILVDGDSYDIGNATRQDFALESTGINKAVYQGEQIKKKVEGIAGRVYTLDQYISKDDIPELIEEGTIVINCADNNAVRKHVEDHVRTLNTAIHICCGNDLKHGQVQVSAKENGEEVHRSIYEESPIFKDGNGDRSVMSCEEMAQLPSGGQLIVANMTAATLALNFLANILENKSSKHLPNDIVQFNTHTNSFSFKGPGFRFPAEPKEESNDTKTETAKPAAA